MAHLFSQGDAVTQDKLEGAAVTYAVIWGVTGGAAPSLGNGSITGVWSRIGDVMLVYLNLVWGSTTTGGSGGANYWTFSLPVAANNTNNILGGVTYAIRQGVAFYPVKTMLFSSTTYFFPSEVGGGFSATAPVTWGNGDQFVARSAFPIA